jgi:hypothetical protein
MGEEYRWAKFMVVLLGEKRHLRKKTRRLLGIEYSLDHKLIRQLVRLA